MPLHFLKITNARNLKNFTLFPHPAYNILYGSNGTGKTTIIESIYLLLRSKTFRSSSYKQFINSEENTCIIFSRFTATSNSKFDDLSSFNLGISRSKDLVQPLLHLNSKKMNSISSISNLVILAVITPESFLLLDSGPSSRRKFIDWGVFHVEHNFISDWKAYKKVIMNRNSILKVMSSLKKKGKVIPDQLYRSLECWSPQLILLNNNLNRYRTFQVEKLSSIFLNFLKYFSPEISNDLTLKFYQGWTHSLTYADYIKNKISDDILSGYTRYGTHRCDLKILYKHYPAKDILSRGQKKIVIMCLILAQFSFLINQSKNCFQSLLLLDDIDSELDDDNLIILFQLLKSINSQTFITTTNINKFSFLNKNEYEMFHVKQ
jgi:DNA replication and repair protein RecF